MAKIQSTARRSRKQDATKKTAGTVKRFTAKSPAVKKTVYRFCRVSKVGKILAASRETVTLDEAETIGDEFGLGIMVARPDVPAGARIMHLRQPTLDRLAALRSPLIRARETAEDRLYAEVVELIVPVYIVLTPGRTVLTATESKQRAEIFREVYDKFHEGDGKAEVIETKVAARTF